MISRRDFLRGLVAGSLLLAGCRPNEDDTPPAPPQSASDQLHSFGLPESNTSSFRRLYAAGPPAEVLLYALAPERLIGWTAQKRPQALAMLSEASRHLPPLGGINGRGSPVSLERLLAEKIDAVVDVGVVSEATVSTAQQTAKQLGVPYLLLEGRLAQSAEQIRQLGSLIASPHWPNRHSPSHNAKPPPAAAPSAFIWLAAATGWKPAAATPSTPKWPNCWAHAMWATHSQAAAWHRFPSNRSSCGSPTGFSLKKPILPFRQPTTRCGKM